MRIFSTTIVIDLDSTVDILATPYLDNVKRYTKPPTHRFICIVREMPIINLFYAFCPIPLIHALEIHEQGPSMPKST